ncbi:hypothetical protein M422DRAFT_774310 [Sphaerobolus stellatus SS14]|nr:hypothetical protein M422DRAFT_774310 [Sphaerobolus stellatus SS14]
MSTPQRAKARCNPLLWAQLRPQRRPVDDASQTMPQPSLAPENKVNSSLRVVLHDTKAVLEQFSDRLGTLVKSVDDAKRQIDSANANLADANDRTIEELVATVNRSQKGLLDVLGTPAQAGTLEIVKDAQSGIQRKLDLLEDRMGLLQKQLQSVTDQQAQILLALASITPLAALLKDSPQQQTQILTMLSPVSAVLPFLHTLPDELKAIHKEISVIQTHHKTSIASPQDHSKTPANVAHLLPSSRTTTSQTSSPRLPRSKSSGQPRVSALNLETLQSLSSSSDPIQDGSSPPGTKTSAKPDSETSARKRPRLDTSATLRTSPLQVEKGRPKTPLKRNNPFAIPQVRPAYPKLHHAVSVQSSLSTPNSSIIPTIPNRFFQSSSGKFSAAATPVRTVPPSTRKPLQNIITPIGPPSAPTRVPAHPMDNYQARSDPVNVNSKPQRRILLDENADEDVEIDLDWGDMASS